MGQLTEVRPPRYYNTLRLTFDGERQADRQRGQEERETRALLQMLYVALNTDKIVQ